VQLDQTSTGMPSYPQTYQLHQTTYGYDPVTGDQTSVSTAPITATLNGFTNFAPVTTSTGYDGDGNAVSVTSANGNLTATIYNHLDQVVSTKLPLLTLYTGGTSQPTTSTAYDADRNVASQTDANGKTTKSSDDPLGRLTGTTDSAPGSGQSINVYSATNLTSSTDPLGKKTSYQYDAAGRQIKVTDPSSNYTTYLYNGDNNHTQVTGFNSSNAALSNDVKTYNAMNWLTATP
jgi:YD repeat-containing protein